MIDYCGKLSNNIFCCKFDALSEKQWARWFNPEHGIDNDLVTNCHWEIIIRFWYPCVDSLPFMSQIITAWPNRTSKITVRLISIIPSWTRSFALFDSWSLRTKKGHILSLVNDFWEINARTCITLPYVSNSSLESRKMIKFW